MGIRILIAAILAVSIFSLVLVGLNQTAEAVHTPDPLPVLTVPPPVTVEATTTSPPGQAVAIGTATCTDQPAHLDADPADPVITNDAPNPNLFPLGETTVTWTCTDAITPANVVTDTQLVTVVDNTPPAVTDAADFTKEATADPNTPVSAVELESNGAATATDIFGIVSLTSDAPATFPLGQTAVHWTAVDGNGLSTTTTSQTVTIIDTTPPTLTIPADKQFEGTAVLTPLSATDLMSASATAFDIFGVGAITNNAPATFPLGDTIVEYSVTDNNGLTTTKGQTITIVDTTPPILTIPPDTSIEADASPTSTSSKDPSVTGVAIATDIVDPSPTVTFSDSSSFPTPNPATKIVEVITRTWTATDASGNSSSADQIITVFDTTAPTITVNDTGFGACAIPVPVNLITFGSTASDLVDPNPSFTNDALTNFPNGFPIGESPVLHTATDASGNVATATELVIVGANDPDGDGITECVDTQKTVPSDDFDDSISEGGQTDGTIDTRGTQDLLIFDVVDPDGILAFAENTGGSTPANIIVCDSIGELELDAGESAIATCTSVKIEILTGQVLIQFNTGGIPGTSTLGPTNILVFDDVALTITNLSATDAVMTFNFKTITIPPGETVSIRHLAFPPNGSSHEPPTIGVSTSGNLIVTCGVAFDGQCFTITASFHEEFKLYEMMSGTHTISITMYCANGVNTCNYAAIGVMPYSESMANTTWKIELYKDFEGNVTPVTTDPEGFLGTVTVTTQIIDDTFWIVSFTVEFKNKDTGPMMFGVQARDSYYSVRNWYLNEGVEFKDSDAYPIIETEFEESLEIDSLCLNEDPNYRYSCAFAKKVQLEIERAEKLLTE